MRAGLIAVATLALAGCASYEAAPLKPDAYPSALDARRLDTRTTPWSEAELLGVALNNNPQVAQAKAKYRTALAAARVARQAPSATLTLTAEYSKDAGGTSPWLYGLGTDFPLDLGARRTARLSAADLTALQALYDEGEAIWAVRNALIRAIAELRGADEAAPLAAEAFRLRQERYDRLSRRVAAGEDARSVALLAQGDLLTAERRVSDVAARRVAALAALAAALGLPSEAMAVAGIDLAPAAEPAIDRASLAVWRNQAALSRRDVLRAVADYDLAESALRLEIAKQYPAISIGPGYTWERGVTKLPFNLGLALPPRDLNRANIARAEAARAEAGASLEATQAAVLAAVDQSAAGLAAARQLQAQTQQRDLPLAQRSADVMHRGVTSGEFDRTDQLAADALTAEAQIAAADAQRAAALAVVDLEQALRRPFDPAQAALLKAKSAGDPA